MTRIIVIIILAILVWTLLPHSTQEQAANKYRDFTHSRRVKQFKKAEAEGKIKILVTEEEL